MKTIGTYLKELRLTSKLSLEDISKQTKIRIDYLEAIEKDNFKVLPAAAFVKGFIRNYTLAVKGDPEKSMAIFRRDFDQNQKGKVVPRGLAEPVETNVRFWSPRTTSAIVVLFGVVLLGIYMLRQVFTLVSAPELIIISPEEGQIFETEMVNVQGKTKSDAVVTVNNQQIVVDSNGDFQLTLDLDSGEHTILVETESRDGKSREAVRTIVVAGKEEQ